jgi:hypothetical protein
METREDLKKELHDLTELIESDYYDTALACAEIGYSCRISGWNDPRIQKMIQEKSKLRVRINELKEKLGIEIPKTIVDLAYQSKVEDKSLPF